MDESAAWLGQAKADREAGESLFRGDRAAARCHVVAKYQFPAAEAVFSDKEVDRFRQLTYDLLAGVGRVISAIRRRPT